MQGPTGTIELMHGYTYSGHPAASAALIATLQIYEREKLFERARELETYWADAVHMLRQAPNVVDVRNIGLVGGIELAPLDGRPGTRGNDVYRRAFDGGLLVRVTGDTVALSPPLIISERRSTRLSRSWETQSPNLRRNSHERCQPEIGARRGCGVVGARRRAQLPIPERGPDRPQRPRLYVEPAPRLRRRSPCAMAYRRCRIERVIGGLFVKGAEVFDARGMAVVPGFIDCHLHPEGETLLYEVLVGNPFEAEFVTIQSIVDKLKARAAKTPPTSGSRASSTTTQR